MVYGSDPGTATNVGGANLSSVDGTLVHQQFTGNISLQLTDTFTTINDSGNNDLGLASGAVLTVNGFIKSGGGPALISGGTSIRAGAGTDLVIRTLARTTR